MQKNTVIYMLEEMTQYTINTLKQKSNRPFPEIMETVQDELNQIISFVELALKAFPTDEREKGDG